MRKKRRWTTRRVRKFFFLWRFFRYERDLEKGTTLDVLFIPFRRT